MLKRLLTSQIDAPILSHTPYQDFPTKIPKRKFSATCFYRFPPLLYRESFRRMLAMLLECAPELRRAYGLREELSAVSDIERIEESAAHAITDWMGRVKQNGLRCFDSILTTLDNWLDEITNHYLDRQRRELQVGFNDRIDVLKRRCYGITNVGSARRPVLIINQHNIEAAY